MFTRASIQYNVSLQGIKSFNLESGEVMTRALGIGKQGISRYIPTNNRKLGKHKEFLKISFMEYSYLAHLDLPKLNCLNC